MCAAAAKSSSEQRKIALLIGNNNYSTSPLSNCVNDANDLNNELQRIGFYVTKATDLIYADMDKRIRQFAGSIVPNDIVFFFYAGHGVQWEDQNYLMPCDADCIEDPIDLRYRATNAQHALELMSAKKPFIIVYLLDCCRNYWLPSMARSRAINSSGGMAPMSAMAGSLVVFACAPGKTAKDKAVNGRNGVFTYHLLRHITKPGEDIFNLMRDVTDGVATETGEAQVPYVMSALRYRNIYLIPPRTSAERLTDAMPLRASAIDIPPNAKWKKGGITVAGGNGKGNRLDQLYGARGLYVDDNQTIYITEEFSHRIMEWKYGATSGIVVAGGNGPGNGLNQLNRPLDVIVDKETDSLIISDYENKRVVRWLHRNTHDTSGETIISNINCLGLTMGENGFLYVVDNANGAVRRYGMDGSDGRVVAGGNGYGNGLHQLSSPQYVFVDRDHSVYVSEWGNHRVTKWEEGAKEGKVVAGGNGSGSSLAQLNCPLQVVVDQLATVYLTDYYNHRVMRWAKGSTEGIVIAGGNGRGGQSNQVDYPVGLSFDRHGNLYVADLVNCRVQKFEIE